MPELTLSEKKILETSIRNEFDNTYKRGLDYDESRYLQLIEISEKLYLGKDHIEGMKKDLQIK